MVTIIFCRYVLYADTFCTGSYGCRVTRNTLESHMVCPVQNMSSYVDVVYLQHPFSWECCVVSNRNGFGGGSGGWGCSNVVGLDVVISLFCEEPPTVAEKISDHFQHCDKLILISDLRKSRGHQTFVVTVSGICCFVILIV